MIWVAFIEAFFDGEIVNDEYYIGNQPNQSRPVIVSDLVAATYILQLSNERMRYEYAERERKRVPLNTNVYGDGSHNG